MDDQKEWLGRGWNTPIAIDPRTGALAFANYEKDIRQAIQIILRTQRGERVMRPDFGCGIHDLVYDVMDVAMLTRVETSVRDALIKYEARIELISVWADPLRAADGMLLVEIEYRVRRTNQTGNYVFPFYFREGGASQAEVRRQ
ncbi:GPW/gp25 family protein [Mesorhizobium sp. M0011]|uniref:GPW/gp25 family protein n=1 Tax=Mesorhizobium sp. M0011 TaxID=2956839 RepID=UPI003339FE00